MKMVLLSVGKQHENYIKEGVDDFTNRIKRYYIVEWQLMNSVRNAATLSIEELKRGEAALINNTLQKGDFLVLLDEKGTELTSQKFVDFLEQTVIKVPKRIVFLIGGAFGVDETIKKAGTISMVFI